MWLPEHQRLLLVLPRYLYCGTVRTIHNGMVMLDKAVIVYDTGPMQGAHWNEAEYLGDWAVPFDKIESWGVTTKTIRPNETRQDEMERDGKKPSPSLDAANL